MDATHIGDGGDAECDAANPKEATCPPVVAYMAEYQGATPLNHNPCYVVQDGT
jgi:hypothetical protein